MGQAVNLDDVRILAGDPNTPTLASPILTGNGQFQFQLSGPGGNEYVIQASSNLTSWIPIATNVIPADGVMTFTDPDATNYSQRFYRAVMP